MEKQAEKEIGWKLGLYGLMVGGPGRLSKDWTTSFGGCPIFLHLESGTCAVLARSLRELARAQFGSKWVSGSLITLTL